MDVPEELAQDKCLELLRAAVVGRVAFLAEEWPRIIPVNYTTVGDAIVLRTTPYSLLGRYGPGARLAFEIDVLDHERHQGWSVVAHGVGEHVEDLDALAAEGPFWRPTTWAGGNRPLFVRLPWSEVTGRRLGQGWTYDNELPVRRPQ